MAFASFEPWLGCPLDQKTLYRTRYFIMGVGYDLVANGNLKTGIATPDSSEAVANLKVAGFSYLACGKMRI